MLIIVTLCVSMGPNVINSYIKKDLLSSKDYWRYNEPEDVEVTDAELAQLIANNGLGDGATYSNGYNDADMLDIAVIKEQTKDVLYKVFGEDEAAFKKIESLVDSEMVHYDRQIVLTVVGSRTMSFVFVNLIYMNSLEQIEIVYEEKTSTVMAFTYQMWEPEKVDWYFIDSFLQSMEAYSENVLGLNNDQYIMRFTEPDYEMIASFSIEHNIEGEKSVAEIEGTPPYEYEDDYYN